MNLKGCGRKRSWPNLRSYLGICLERLRKTKDLNIDRRSPFRDLNPGPSEYESGVLTTRSRRSVGKHESLKYAGPRSCQHNTKFQFFCLYVRSAAKRFLFFIISTLRSFPLVTNSTPARRRD
jgi:hypothetical protein